MLMSEIEETKPSDVLTALQKEDLGHFSRDELIERMAILAAEIKRSEAVLNSKQGSHDAAEALFKNH
jgi:uncharacterized small protein (DUF1192 family)